MPDMLPHGCVRFNDLAVKKHQPATMPALHQKAFIGAAEAHLDVRKTCFGLKPNDEPVTEISVQAFDDRGPF
jgi:hypothetical protein